jgi:hypothetical protein
MTWEKLALDFSSANIILSLSEVTPVSHNFFGAPICEQETHGTVAET